MIHVSQDMISSVTDPITGEIAHIHRFTLVNDVTKTYVQVISYGAAIFSLRIPDESGKLQDVVLGFDLIQDYEDESNPYFGATIGRVCNRIANGHFTIYDKEIQVSLNHGDHHLHGGSIGFDKVAWNLKEIHENGVTFCHRSPDGHEGYPGELFATVRYTLHDDNTLRIHMTAKTTVTTVVNMTNHSYFNLAGHDAGREALYQHTVSIFGRDITQTDNYCIPTGIYLPVVHTAYDFRCGENLGRRIRQIEDRKLGFDDNYCVTQDGADEDGIVRVAKVVHQPTGRWMEVYSNQPGVQFYTGNFLPDERKGETLLKGRNKATYQKHGAFCLETQKYPDAPNHKHFPSIVLRPGELYEHVVHYKFGTLRCKAPLTRLSEVDDIEYIDVSNADTLEDDVYADISAEITSTSKSELPDEGSRGPSLEGSNRNLREDDKPQSSDASKEPGEEKKEAAILEKIEEKPGEHTAEKAAEKAADQTADKAAEKTIEKSADKPAEQAAQKSQEAVPEKMEVEVTVEKEAKEELNKETKKYKVDAECQTGEAAAAPAKVVKEKKEAEAQTDDDEEQQGACGGAPKETAKK
uniref:Galactose mutarotase n=1 Tax=Bactrocera dorsalis TaxID=27457 RepID=A0A034VT21_BACDO